jgi:hypothetical protein
LPDYPVSKDVALLAVLIAARRSELMPEPKRRVGNPGFKKHAYSHVLDDIESDARWLKDHCKLKLYDCRLAAATHWLRAYGYPYDAEQNEETPKDKEERCAADLVEKIYSRANQ